ncbi:putative membrane protein [Clostridium bornimense]|uniref:Putative membrane protein n=1 Tax=Clostridium bornimense TaxID=1216932 RepID=W6RVY5_9CLOT|nr:glycosyl hydrolase family 8 [Clostridium bornimense]CDM68523.1 putative membrane protein [Clostridium bornimense]
MKKKKIIIIAIIVMLGGIGSIIAMNNKLEFKLPINGHNKILEVEDTVKFINNNLSDVNGIYTNYLEKESAGDETKGHYVLSESEGLMMLYGVETGNKDIADTHLKIIENMMMENNLVSWRVRGEKKSMVSSTIDDLRIVKASALAYKRFDDAKYRKVFFKLSEGIKNNSVYKGCLVDFNDNGILSDTVTLSYMDLGALSILADVDKDYKEIEEKSKKIVEGGYISDAIPLYRKSYNINEEEYSKEENNDLLLTSMIYLYKSEVGEDTSKFLYWVKDKLNKDGFLCSTYSSETGEATSKVESTAIYSVVAMVARNSRETNLYNKLKEKLSLYKIDEGDLKGAFGYLENKEIYSFDNLMAILALIE